MINLFVDKKALIDFCLHQTSIYSESVVPELHSCNRIQHRNLKVSAIMYHVDSLVGVDVPDTGNE